MLLNGDLTGLSGLKIVNAKEANLKQTTIKVRNRAVFLTLSKFTY